MGNMKTTEAQKGLHVYFVYCAKAPSLHLDIATQSYHYIMKLIYDVFNARIVPLYIVCVSYVIDIVIITQMLKC